MVYLIHSNSFAHLSPSSCQSECHCWSTTSTPSISSSLSLCHSLFDIWVLLHLVTHACYACSTKIPHFPLLLLSLKGHCWLLVNHIHRIHLNCSPLTLTIFCCLWLLAPHAWLLSFSTTTCQPPLLHLFKLVHLIFTFSPRSGTLRVTYHTATTHSVDTVALNPHTKLHFTSLLPTPPCPFGPHHLASQSLGIFQLSIRA